MKKGINWGVVLDGEIIENSRERDKLGNSIIFSLKTLIYHLFTRIDPNFLYLTSLGILRFILTGTNTLVIVGGNAASPHYQYTSLT